MAKRFMKKDEAEEELKKAKSAKAEKGKKKPSSLMGKMYGKKKEK